MRLSQGNTSPKAVSGGNASSGEKKEVKTSTGLSTTDKLKASNFPASLLRIGCWEVSFHCSFKWVYHDS